MEPTPTPLVSTIKEHCRVCYTCVRECPAKAIRIADSQAEVIAERCIGCGNCVRVCSQKAKRVLGSVERVRDLLRSDVRVAAILAPSFPAEFVELDDHTMVGMLRKAGFDSVHEVGFGADLVARAYRRLVEDHPDRRYIATSCPAVVAYVERYHPNLVNALAPIVSPMIASARVLREKYPGDLRIVFIGPCIAKKGEARSAPVRDDVDAVLTFAELYELFDCMKVEPYEVKPSEFDGPFAGAGALFPITRGMLQAADMDEDLATGEIVTADGCRGFVEAIREFESGDLDAQLLEALCCNGCIMGAGMTTDAPLFRRRARVSRSVRQRMLRLDQGLWRKAIAKYSCCDLGRTYQAYDQRIAGPTESEIVAILTRMGKTRPEDELNCGACGYETCHEHAVAIIKGLAESEMCLPYTIEQLRRACEDLTSSNEQLASTQEALMQSEKLASMGQLAAGIAHEVNNPLGTVLMLSHILLNEAGGNTQFREDLSMIASEADRCKKIVAGLLHFARKNKVEAQRADMASMVDRIVKTLHAPPAIEVSVEHETADTTADMDRDQIMQVLSNVASNAIAAMPHGGKLTFRIRGDSDNILLDIQDTGEGIAEENLRKVFEPFFTTKPPGQGTGLGLSVSYGIVKMHHGDISVRSNADASKGPTGSTFTLTLPRVRKLSPAAVE